MGIEKNATKKNHKNKTNKQKNRLNPPLTKHNGSLTKNT